MTYPDKFYLSCKGLIVMKLQPLFSPTAISLVLIAALSADARVQAGTFTQPAGLPVATVPTAYLDTATGNLQLNPAGRFISSYIFNAGITNPTVSTVGPFVYMNSTASQSSKISTGSVTKSFPVGTVTSNSTGWQSQLGQAIFSPLVSDGNNIASNGLPNDSLGDPLGTFNLAWSFGITAPSLTSDSLVRSTFVADTATDIGYGAGKSQFLYTQYAADGTPITGNSYGEVIPYSSVVVPEPSSIVMAGMGIALLGLGFGRRRNA